jgi:hypothetical protein
MRQKEKVIKAEQVVSKEKHHNAQQHQQQNNIKTSSHDLQIHLTMSSTDKTVTLITGGSFIHPPHHPFSSLPNDY